MKVSKLGILNSILSGFSRKSRMVAVMAAASFAVPSMAQYDPYFAHYYDMPAAFNPAAAGKDARINVTATYTMAMAGFEDAPSTALVAGDIPFAAMKSIHGLGVQLMSDKLGLFNHQRLTAQYALRKRLAGGWLSGGIQAGLLNEKFNGSKIELGDENDDVFSKSDIDGNALDLGAGLYYSRNVNNRQWYAGISATHLTSPTVRLGEQYELNIAPMFYCTGGATIQLHNPVWKVAASALVQSELVTYRADITGRLIYTYDQKMFYGGVTYTPTISTTILVGGNFHGILLGYSYEMYTNGINLKNGSHELFVGYQMDVDLGKKGKNYHQTTRTL